MATTERKSLDELSALARAKQDKAAATRNAEIAARNAEKTAIKQAALGFLGDAPATLTAKVMHDGNVTDVILTLDPKIYNSGNVGYWQQGYFTIGENSYKVQVTVTRQ